MLAHSAADRTMPFVTTSMEKYQMDEEADPHPQALVGLGIWAAQAVAALIAELHSRDAVGTEFVDQIATRLGEYDADAPPGAKNAYEAVRFLLSGKWLGDG
ncbi:MAG: hypothetical protein CMH85_01225 [Novosphingobium sp.]|nr:hypothetical protein [Novosphingobium sp.]